jgi:DNA polymerase/3'-5' exonuclease PolX
MSNLKLVRLLTQLYDCYDILGDEYRAKAYQTATKSIAKLNTDITVKNLSTLDIPGVGEGISKKIIEILKTGRCIELERLQKDPNIASWRELGGILGVGGKTIKTWISRGITDLTTLRKAVKEGIVKLTKMQLEGLKYYKDLNQQIPRAEVTKLGSHFYECAKMVGPATLTFQVVGSYIRGLPTCGDVDILVSYHADKGIKNITFIDDFLELIQEDPCVVSIIVQGPQRCTFLYKSFVSGLIRQVDILYIKPNSYPAALLYFTGSYEFNRYMRGIAKKKGYLLNQDGLFKNGKMVKAKSEEDIFRILGLKYLKPSQR